MTSSDKKHRSNPNHGRSTSSAIEIVEVPFHGGTVSAINDGGTIFVPIKRVCETLGIDEYTQIKKLKGKPWAVTSMKLVTASDGKNYEMACIDIDALPMWLATIEASRVKPAIRPTLVAYQKECARVLRDYFFHGAAINPAISSEQLADLIVELRAISNDNACLRGTVTDLSNNVRSLRHELDCNLGTCGAGGSTIRERINSIARLLEPNGKKRRSAQLKTDQKIRNACEWPRGQGRSWENMPRIKAPAAKVLLDQLETEAEDLARARELARQRVLFEPANDYAVDPARAAN